MMYQLNLRLLLLLFLSFVVGCEDKARKGRPSDVFSDKQVVALCLAIEQGNVQEIERLVESGVSVNAIGDYGYTPLLWCIVVRNKPSYKRLLELGADPNHQHSSGDSAVSLAASMKRDSYWLECALKHKADANIVDKVNKHVPNTTPVFDAIRSKNADNVRLLIAHGADVQFKNGRGQTPLMYATDFLAFEIIHVLMVAGADLDAHDKFGRVIRDRIERRIEPSATDEVSEKWRGSEIWRRRILQLLKKKKQEEEERKQ